MKSYKYVGPEDLLDLVLIVGKGQEISDSKDVHTWIKNTGQEFNSENHVIATYIIGLNGNLLIADRHSEHVVCAGGEDVLSAGEVTFYIEGSNVTIVDITNQSTGYCPAPESWPAVDSALKKANLSGLKYFSREFIFRICNKCGLLNIVKENWFECVGCNTELSKI